MKRRLGVAAVCLAVWACVCGRAGAASLFVPGDIYATRSSYNAVSQYDASGQHKSTKFLPSDPNFGMAHGITFGPDGLLYFVKHNYPNSGGEVLAVDSAGQVQQRYGFQAAMSSIAVGDIAFDTQGHFYVGAVGRVFRFTIGAPDSGSVIWQPSSYVYGLDVLPSGNLLVGLEYGPHEFDPVTGAAREIAGVGAVRGLGYDAANDSVVVSTIGDSATPDRIRRFDRITGALLDSVNVRSPTDVHVRPDGTIVAGSYSGMATLFDAHLNVTGQLESSNGAIFVTTLVPEPAGAMLAAGACAALALRRPGRRAERTVRRPRRVGGA